MGCSEFRRELREEFRLRNFCMNHDDPSLFVKLQCLKPVFHVLWVVFWFLFFVSLVVLEIVYHYDEGSRYFIFLTNITFIIQKMAVTMDFVVTLYVHFRRTDIRDGLSETTPWYIQVKWVMFNVVNPSSLIVSVGYYSLGDAEFTHASINLHILNSVYTILLLLFSAKPVRILHFYQPMIYAAFYTIISAIYNVSEHDPVYGVEGPLDWEKKTTRASILSAIVICVVVPAMHLFCFGVYRLRVFVSRRCTCINKVDYTKDPKA